MRKGFTLIELLIVILIIGVMATATLTSYTKTKQAAELSLLTDKFVSDLRGIKSSLLNANEKCLGFEVHESGKIIKIEADYENPFTRCNPLSISAVEDFAQEDFKIVEMKASNKKIDSLQILLIPPRGEIYSPGQIDEQIFELKMALGNKTNSQIVTINTQNSTITKTYND